MRRFRHGWMTITGGIALGASFILEAIDVTPILNAVAGGADVGKTLKGVGVIAVVAGIRRFLTTLKNEKKDA